MLSKESLAKTGSLSRRYVDANSVFFENWDLFFSSLIPHPPIVCWHMHVHSPKSTNGYKQYPYIEYHVLTIDDDNLPSNDSLYSY